MKDKLPQLVSGITSTGNLTLGNYIGAIKNFIKLQSTYKMFIFIADLHGITAEKINPEKLSDNIRQMAALYIACGIDPEKSVLFLQSDVLEHCELAHILSCNTSLGELQRMTQFKDKSQKLKLANQTMTIPTGLLIYPPLMAADILLYDADLVPVGQDQKQHIELTRNLAIRLNNRYKANLFKIPEPYFGKVGKKIMDLQDPTKKMSKSSLNLKSFIHLLDDRKTVLKKIKSALTDSENKIYFDSENKPGISNLLNIYCALKNIEIKEAEEIFINTSYGEFKNKVANAISETLEPIQEKYAKLYNSPDLDKILYNGAQKAKKFASVKLTQVKQVIGLTYKQKETRKLTNE